MRCSAPVPRQVRRPPSSVQPVGDGRAQWPGPAAHLREVLTHVAEHPINRIEELLPWTFAAMPAMRRAA